MSAGRLVRCKARAALRLLMLPLLLAVAGCGPALIVAGIDELRGTENTTILLLIVNDGGELLQFELGALLAGGQVQQAPAQVLLPGQQIEVQVPRPEQVRLRAHELLRGSRPPLVWEVGVTAPNSGTVARLAASAAVASVAAAAPDLGPQQPGSFELSRVVAMPGGAAAFTRLARTTLPFPAAKTVLHPSGAYLYAFEEPATGPPLLHGFRIDAATGALEAIAVGFGSAPAEPVPLPVAVPAAELLFVVEPLGRAAYMVENDTANTQGLLTVFAIAADGSLSSPVTTQRGLITDLAFRADGSFAYFVERSAAQDFVVRELQVLGSGLPGPTTATKTLPCSTANTREPSALAVHPGSEFVYVAYTDGAVRLGAYFIGAGLFDLVDTACSGLDTIVDLSFDPAGAWLYATGTVTGTPGLQVARYPIEARTGRFGALASEQLGATEMLAATRDPGAATGDPLADLVYVSIDDQLSARRVGPAGVLESVAGDPALAIGDPARVQLLVGLPRGAATIQRGP